MAVPQPSSIEAVLESVARFYPPHMVAEQLHDIPRAAFNIRLALNGLEPQGLSICDIGGGIGVMNPGMAALGMNVLLVDDFADAVNIREGASQFDIHLKYGVRIVSRDVVKDGLSDISEKFDIVSSFDSIEHWHHSPKAVLHDIRNRLLKPGGRFVLGVPNCVNLRKRITVPFGYGKWTSMQSWYEEPVFRSHVREPDVDDLRYIATDLRLREAAIIGRNWMGLLHRNKMIRFGTRIVDRVLQVFPSLCSDLYLVGHA